MVNSYNLMIGDLLYRVGDHDAKHKVITVDELKLRRKSDLWMAYEIGYWTDDRQVFYDHDEVEGIPLTSQFLKELNFSKVTDNDIIESALGYYSEFYILNDNFCVCVHEDDGVKEFDVCGIEWWRDEGNYVHSRLAPVVMTLKYVHELQHFLTLTEIPYSIMEMKDLIMSYLEQ